MSLLSKVLPPPSIALEMEPEELAVFVLECLCQAEESRSTSILNRYAFMLSGNLQDYARDNCESIAKVIAEAWNWLEREGLIAPKPGEQGEWIFITRRGYKFRKAADVRSYLTVSLLPDKSLDPRLALKVRPSFLRGDYDTAVFEAFKEVEVRVRNLSGADKMDLGVNLMRKAFHPETGKLTDTEQIGSERQAVSDLFSGAIGSFKNPSSHRDVNFDDPVEVVSLIMLADHLIKIAERRKP
jgi:uncharacterized protein (TIGR02391 family)